MPILQPSLFPDAFAILERALAALDELDLPASNHLAAEAREADPGQFGLEPLREALTWLGRELGFEPVSNERLALHFLAVPEARRNGEITTAAAELIDGALARQGLSRMSSGQAFLDEEGRVHRGALLLVLRRAAEALPFLQASLAEGDARADLWAALAEACFALERFEESNSAWVRALLISAREIEFSRMRHPLADLQRELAALHGEARARELLLVHSWLDGLLVIPAANGWLDSQLSRLHLAVAPQADATSEQRLRRFSLLFYLDRSRGPGHCDESEREEMQSLAPELFRRVMQAIQVREKTATRPLRW